MFRVHDVRFGNPYSLSRQSANHEEKTSVTELSTCYVTCGHYMQSSAQAVYEYSVDALVYCRLNSISHLCYFISMIQL